MGTPRSAGQAGTRDRTPSFGGSATPAFRFARIANRWNVTCSVCPMMAQERSDSEMNLTKPAQAIDLRGYLGAGWTLGEFERRGTSEQPSAGLIDGVHPLEITLLDSSNRVRHHAPAHLEDR